MARFIASHPDWPKNDFITIGKPSKGKPLRLFGWLPLRVRGADMDMSKRDITQFFFWDGNIKIICTL